jgi:hypothetical protein
MNIFVSGGCLSGEGTREIESKKKLQRKKSTHICSGFSLVGTPERSTGRERVPVSIISKSISSTSHQLVDDSLNSMVI